MDTGRRYRQHWLQTLSHIARLLRSARTAELYHVQAEATVAAIAPLARLALLTSVNRYCTNFQITEVGNASFIILLLRYVNIKRIFLIELRFIILNGIIY